MNRTEIRTLDDERSSFISTTEAGTMQLELRTLCETTGNLIYANAPVSFINNMVEALPDNRVVPQAVDSDPLTVQDGFNTSGLETIGAHVNSFVQMLLKTWIWSGKQDGLLQVEFERQFELLFQELSFYS